MYETKPKQNVLVSDAWKYLFGVNLHFVTDYPYWFSKPDSYYAILISDTFGDYYNLFNNVTRIEALPVEQKILVGNGRYTTPKLWRSLLWTNRIGLFIYLIWIIGFIGKILSSIKQRKIDKYELFLLVVLLGGWLALLYNNLRLPYLERGVLKAHFIYFTYPILTLLAYSWWWQKVKNKWIFAVIALLPFIIYFCIAWPMIYLE